MTYFIAGLIALIVFSGGLNAILGANPKWLSAQMRKAGGVAAIIFGVFLVTRGQWELAIPVVIAGTTLLGLMPGQGMLSNWGNAGSKTPRQTSTVRSTFIEMELDLDTGQMGGRFVAGSLAGQRLEQIQIGRLVAAFSEIDAESAALLEAYLDRRDPSWRENAQGNAGARQGGAPASSAMTEQEAHEILGLQPGADDDAIRNAHRTLMKKIHPDQGGSTWIASRVNQAKDVLLGRHNRNS
ncbi:molecular chaperone DnaJ [Phreatobacter aquaticus]|uniref:Molecular chaperone DnaJ n=1 Tax=Phreatobacter aquaticus TaxID=2570229 RepID=A0A4D7QJ29_9HYPH|nr:DnaJ domain-containing protein [Phreatobacter aquaticus]QCK87670.1 molecular chaperone DnaJ [Phreatobacter aquaticus]